MSPLSIGQIILIVVLILNLIIWMLVIFFRLFRRQPTPRRRPGRSRRRLSRSSLRARRLLASLTSSAFLDEENPEENAYNISASVDVPPSYEEATKYDGVHAHRVLAHHGVPPSFDFQNQVVLSVPEEPTSTSETRLLSTLSPVPRQPQLNLAMARRIMARRIMSAPARGTVPVGESPFDFAVHGIRTQADRTSTNHDLSTAQNSDRQHMSTQSPA